MGVNKECSLTEEMGKRQRVRKWVVVMKNYGANLDTVSRFQDVPECMSKVGEIHLMASS